jgi:hypothetical protein
MLRLSPNAEWYIKLDPDTRITRRLSCLPSADLFGYMRVRTDARKRPIINEPFITTAFVGLNQSAVRLLVESNELLNPLYCDSFYSFEQFTGEPLSIGSWILHDATKRLGLKPAPHPEIYLQWRSAVPAELWEQYAVVNVEGRQ